MTFCTAAPPVVAALGLALMLTTAARADDAPAETPDKSGYTLLNPTPDDQLRSFNTDRPNKGTSPYTIDAGHFQYETDLFNYTYDRSSAGDVTTRSLVTADPVLKLGLTNDIEAELGVTGYAWTRSDDRMAGQRINHGEGFGDLVTKLKVNVLGNDGGTYALALVPWVKLPTGAAGLGNNLVEGGLIVPLAINLPDDWTLSLQTEFDALKNANDSGRHANFINLVSVSHAIVGNLSGAVELYAQNGTDRFTPDIYTADAGLSYLITPTLQIDAGINVGFNRAAPDLNPYIGLSQRF
ncbi:MAG TPA: transporter [Aliidongia sp.]|uniref:transporter n=1 Tax=Aliidongia sp. TaxID=1914230 RepID=UPI002DDD2102|nr:transporter [Aliidongia sp.]HEV2674323.1 transporter [Aliidongia sp.]